jgi:catechol 2,3-dioxygenase-like lactoylglutathione lyase family enzyme
MFKAKATFSGIAGPDLPKLAAFYRDTLGLKVDEDPMGLHIQLPHGGELFAYGKPDHQPANSTCFNLVVDDIDAAVDELAKQGVQFDRFEGFGQDEKGIARGRSHNMGPDIAWFKDPAGNTLAVLQPE